MVMFVSGAFLLFWHYLEARNLQLRPAVRYDTVGQIPSDIRAGDVFIRGGSPGHAVLVMDMAVNAAGQKIFLLAQSYMPAQDIHILKNPGNPPFPWYYTVGADKLVVTPEWVFKWEEVMRFR
jgi:hypothetical protein